MYVVVEQKDSSVWKPGQLAALQMTTQGQRGALWLVESSTGHQAQLHDDLGRQLEGHNVRESWPCSYMMWMANGQHVWVPATDATKYCMRGLEHSNWLV